MDKIDYVEVARETMRLALIEGFLAAEKIGIKG